MKFWNTTLKNMKEYIPGEQPENISEYIKLNTNENPFPPSRLAIDAIAQNTERLNRYPEPASDSLRHVFAETNDLKIENIFASNGSDEIFTLIFRGFANKKALAAFPYPSYSLYDTLAEASGIPYEKVNLKKNFEYNLNDFLKKDYQLVIIANPNNPTGTRCTIQDIDNFLGGIDVFL
jgi:histidinol-phosphate aminotransferase